MRERLSKQFGMNKLRLLRRKLAPLYLILCFLSFFIIDFSLRYIYRHLFTVDLFSRYPMIFSVSWSLLLTTFLGILPGRTKRIVMMLLVVIFGLFSIAHAVIFNIFGNFFSFADFAYLGDGVRFFSFSYLKVRKLLILSVLFAIAMMGVAAWLSAANSKLHRRKEFISCIAMLLLSAISITLVHTKLMNEGKKQQVSWRMALAQQSESAIYEDFSNVNQCMGITGLYQYTARNFVVSTGLERWAETSSVNSKLDRIYQERMGKYNMENEMTGVFEGKNLMLIMLESIDTWMINEDYMPELYSVQQKSINFTRHYTPLFINSGTFNTEFTALTGLLTPTSGIRKGAYTSNDFSWSLPSLFRGKGYSANSFHSADPIIYDRGNIHRNIGFEDYYCWYDLGMENYMKDSQLINGFDKMVANKPFFSFIITYSGHGPYTDEMEAISGPHFEKAVEKAKLNGIVGDDENTLEHYRSIAHAMETDAFIGSLMDKLEETGLIEDTVVILFSDHYSKYMTDTEYLLGIKGVSNTDLLCNTPFMIYGSDIKPRNVDLITSTIDIFPTIVNMFKLNADLTYFVGDDIFGESRHDYVMFRNYSWYDGEVYYSSDYKGEITEEIAAKTQEVIERVNLSWDTLRSDYFRYLLKKNRD
ncbi:MAG: sulfatase-like hydrolase/transferase [Clostridiaceae bacterium]|nr:sulfatase-like hydrolase/transferase [Clostridiaceae bacterium]